MAHLSVAAEAEFVPGVSLQARALGIGLRHTVRPVLDLWSRLPFDYFPPNLVEHAARVLPVHEGTSWRSVDLPQCRSEWLRAKGVGDLHHGNTGAILYLHGGAFLTCGLNTHRRLVSRISFAADQPVLNVGYRQMPHEPIAESAADGLDGFRWLLGQGYRAEDITIAGDSAGGYLAFAVARAAMDAGLGRPAGIVAISPLLDFDPAGKTAHRNAHTCQTFSLRAVARLTAVTHAMETRRGIAGRRICPVNMPLADMPPALIHIGSREVLMADAELMANRLVSAGVACTLKVWDRQVHVFQAAASWVPEARTAIDEIGAFVRARAAAEASPVPHRTSRTARTAAAVDRVVGG
ncbi:hydrolase, alpha/beta domain protein [Aeromicrobium marinum DSM 15272]|uniref:Hydrolase, alpha/beta domain protein n=1 Tax=Aeromicrobium marinum DSM 15272 TaxID=585531 RepID=E2SDP7_9ACTN|nr:alpha/beta hydrolase [Aeromicrobium marinum]EFQ82624.1 hydrolase, alpha/beta domain protein [Aeromicrobium marinum DSM 15272]